MPDDIKQPRSLRDRWRVWNIMRRHRELTSPYPDWQLWTVVGVMFGLIGSELAPKYTIACAIVGGLCTFLLSFGLTWATIRRETNK